MKKFLFLGLFVAATLVSCKDKAAEAPVEEAPVEEAAPVQEAPAADTTAMPADTTAAQ
ncbi:MAG: hypothetical protein IPN79_14420 [Saprospiraceae bacterium]|jgi:hypothetical protein|nr:hypothetical protein [Saprospiraceae bacterium]